MSHLSETTSGTVSEHARHVSTLDDTLIILEGLRSLVIAIVREIMFALSLLKLLPPLVC